MSFLSMSPLLAGLVLAGTAAAVAVLYWLKPPPRRMVVPSKLLWNRLLKEKRRSTLLDRLRWWISLMIALTIGLSVAAALGRPEFSWGAGDIARMTIVMDNSATMATRASDGFTRWEHAVALARELLEQGSVDAEFLILDTSGQAPSWDSGDRRSALDILDALTVSWDVASRFPSPVGGDGPVYFISDGVMVDDVPPEVEVISVYDLADNVGVTAFEVGSVPSAPLEYQAFLEITNASPGPKEVSVRLSGAGEGGLRETVMLQAGESRGRTVDLSSFDRGPVRVTVTTDGDAFAADDLAFSFLPVRSRTRIALVSPGSVYLQSALADEPRLRVNTLTPEEYDESVGADLYIFDRWAPEEPPPGPALLFLPPNIGWLAPTVAVLTSPAVSGWDPDHPLMRFVSLEDLRIDRAVRFAGTTEASSDWRVIIGTTDLPLMIAAEAPQKIIRVAFALEDSNLPLQPAFPIFVSNVLSWMMDEQGALPRTPGRVEVPLAEGEVTDLEGGEIAASQVSGRTVFVAEEPGLYTVAAGGRRVRVAVSLADRERTAVNASSFSPDDRATASPTALRLAGEQAGGGDLWVVLLGVAALLVIVEWFTYHRRWTV